MSQMMKVTTPIEVPPGGNGMLAMKMPSAATFVSFVVEPGAEVQMVNAGPKRFMKDEAFTATAIPSGGYVSIIVKNMTDAAKVFEGTLEIEGLSQASVAGQTAGQPEASRGPRTTIAQSTSTLFSAARITRTFPGDEKQIRQVTGDGVRRVGHATAGNGAQVTSQGSKVAFRPMPQGASVTRSNSPSSSSSSSPSSALQPDQQTIDGEILMRVPNGDEKCVVFVKGHVYGLLRYLESSARLPHAFVGSIIEACNQGVARQGGATGNANDMVVLLTLAQIRSISLLVRRERGPLNEEEKQQIIGAIKYAITHDGEPAQIASASLAVRPPVPYEIVQASHEDVQPSGQASGEQASP